MGSFSNLIKNAFIDSVLLHKRKILISLAILIFLITANLIINHYTDQLVARLIKELVAKESDGFYHVQFKEVGYHINTGSFHLTNFVFAADSTLPTNKGIEIDSTHKVLYTAKVPELDITLESLWDLYVHRKLKITGIQIIEPNLKIHSEKQILQNSSTREDTDNIYNKITEYLRVFQIDDFTLKDGQFEFITLQGADFENYRVNDISFAIYNFLLTEGPDVTHNKIFFTDNVEVEIKNQELNLPDGLHKLAFDRLLISTLQKRIELDNFRLYEKPFASVSDSNKSYTNRMDIRIPKINLTGIEFIQAIEDSILYINNLKIDRPTARTLLHIIDRTVHQKKNNDDLFFKEIVLGTLDISDGSFDHNTKMGEINSRLKGDVSEMIIKNLRIAELQDTNRPEISYDDMKLNLKNAEIRMRDGIHIYKAGRIHLAGNPLTISIQETNIQPIQNYQIRRKLIGYNVPTVFRVNAEDIKIEEFDLMALVNNDIIAIQNLHLVKPKAQIEHFDSKKDVIDPSSARNQKPLPLHLGRLSILQGSLDYSIDNNNELLKIVYISDFDLSLQHLISSDSAADVNLPKYEDLDIDIEEVAYFLKNSNQTIRFKKAISADFPNKLTLEDLSLENGSIVEVLNNKAIDKPEVQIGNVTFSGFKPEEWMLGKAVVLDSLLISGLKINKELENSQIDYTKNKTPAFPAFQIKYLLVNSDNIRLLKNGMPKLYLEKSEIRLQSLKFPNNLKSDSKIPGFENLIFKIEKGLLYGKDENHLLSLNQILLNTEKQELRAKRILFEPLNTPGDHSKFNIEIPDLNVDQLDIKQWLLDSTLHFNNLRFSQPKASLYLVAKKQTDIKKRIKFDSIQLPLDNFFKKIQGNKFDVTNASLSITTEKDNEMMEYSAKNIDFSLEFIQWSPGDLMVDNHLLFSTKTSIQVDYFTYYKPGKKEFLNINHVQISDNPNLLRAEGIYFSNNTGSAEIDKAKLKVELQDFQVHGLNYLKLLRDQELISNSIQILQPNIRYQTIAGPKKVDTHATEKKTGKEAIAPLKVLADNLMIKDGRLEFISTSEKGTGKLQLPHLDLRVSNLHLEPGAVHYTNTDEVANQIQLDISNASYLMPGNLNTLRIERISSDIDNAKLSIRNFELQPNVSKYEYGPLKGFQTDWVRLRNKEITFNNINYNSLIFDEKIQLQSIEVNGLTVNLLRDKRVPFPEDQRRGMPQAMIRSIPLPIQIDTVYLNDLAVTYQEHGEKSQAPGEVFFTDLQGRLINVTNDSAILKDHPKMFMEASGKIMGKGQIKAEFTFDMVDPQSSHSFGATVGPFDLTEFNRMLIPTAFVQVKSGVNKGIIMNLTGNDDYSYGEMKFYYENLKIQLLDKETELPKGMGNAFISFFANTFFINTNNPRLLIFRKGDIFFERDKSKSIFNYWSKSFLSGIVSSIGAKNNKKKIKNAQETELKKYDSAITQSPTK